MHGCTFCHHNGNDLRKDLHLIEHILSTPNAPKTCPIAYLIPRVPYGLAHSDSSLTAASSYCLETTFWWYLKWTTTIQSRTVRHIQAKYNPTLISINSLKYAAQLIMMLGCHLHHRKTSVLHQDTTPKKIPPHCGLIP